MEAPLRAKPQKLCRPVTAAAHRVAQDLQRSSGAAVRRRRAIISLELIATSSMGLVALRQLGMIPDLGHRGTSVPNARIGTQSVVTSPRAYWLLHTPDSLLGLASYAGTALLAGMGGADRAQRTRFIPAAMGLKLALDVASALLLTREELASGRRLCAPCLLACACAIVAAPLGLPEVLDALGQQCPAAAAPQPRCEPSPSDQGISARR